jgi:ABC-2 type transport system ATP-binding protein
MKLEVRNLKKSFGHNDVLKDVSFSVDQGEIFGLLGPNGAGKTTMIRIILNILRQDGGTVKIFGKEFSESIKEKIGYLPEEGGLYKDTTVTESIRYFAALKNRDVPAAKLTEYLKQFDLYDHADKKVQDLSKGMQRKLMFIIAVVHEPDILILDEPFAGLDPVNRELVKNLLLEYKKRGMTIIMSTHQMDEVERMCDRILMLHHGKRVLYGDLTNIKKKYGFSVFVDYEGRLPKLAGVEKVADYGSRAELVLSKGTDTQTILKKLAARVKINKFEVKTHSLNEIFISVVQNEK